MNILPGDKRITPHWLMRLCKVRGARLFIASNELILENAAGERFVVHYENLPRKNTLKRKLFFFELAVPTEQGVHRLRGLRKADIEDFFIWLQDCLRWLREYQKFARVVRQCAQEIHVAITQNYLRHSRWQKFREIARVALNQFHKIPPLSCLKQDDYDNFILVQKMAFSTEQDAQEYRAQYVRRAKEKFSNYFDHVVSDPLTEKQRDACIIDEDNNLVLAGAGTGKTSTMIGRAGFLVKSGLAKPQQILMLAFAKKSRPRNARASKQEFAWGIHNCKYIS